MLNAIPLPSSSGCHAIELFIFFFSSRRRHTRSKRDWSSGRVLFRSGDLRDTDEVVQYSEPARQIYWKAIVRDGKLSAACLLGDLGPADNLMRLFQADAPVPDRQIGRASCRERVPIPATEAGRLEKRS